MRISDWSSDVCSSDLPRHLAGVDDGLCDRDRECDNFVESLAVENPEPVRSSDFNEMFATGLVPMGIVREGFGRDAELLRRSEEHTSELQSLMRISYAVFCLKKKKEKHQMQPPKEYII